MKSQTYPPPRLVTALVALAVLLGGCSTAYVVQVDAISQASQVATNVKPLAQGQSYHIRTSNPRHDESSLRYKEVENYVKTALSGKGMYEAPRPEKADVIVDIDYGIDAPRMKFEVVSNPVYAMSRGETEYSTVPIYSNGRVVGYQTIAVRAPPRLTMVGMTDEVRPVIVYEKFLKISARANQEAGEGKPGAEVWSVNVSAEDDGKELRKYLPILASASADYIGTNTKQSKAVKIRESDEVVDFIKKGM